MSAAQAAVGVLVGLVSGMLSGLFGVGGGIVMTPGIQFLLGAPPIVALATPLPVILPTAITGAYTYGRARELDTRAAAWIVGPGIVGADRGSLAHRCRQHAPAAGGDGHPDGLPGASGSCAARGSAGPAAHTTQAPP